LAATRPRYKVYLISASLKEAADLSGAALEHLVPVSGVALTEETHGRIPGAVRSPQQPAPVGHRRQDHPHRHAQSARHMGQGRVLRPRLDERGAFVDMAAVMTCLDLVVTSDTAVAHWAGAPGGARMARAGFCARLALAPGAPRHPWYPSMRLFRQQSPGDWKGSVCRDRARWEQPWDTSSVFVLTHHRYDFLFQKRCL
jgi:hypothetical protein